jgi:LuxR family maltose regulon positive regulatory protein
MAPAPLIVTKLHAPVARADLVSRPALFRLLEAGLQLPLILVSAPPGFGKSMLVAGWLRSRPSDLQVAWLVLDAGDNTPVFFWRYFVAALQGIDPGLGRSALAMLSAPGPLEIEPVLTTLINELADIESPLLLVLDDYELIQNASIHEALNFLLDHLPVQLHLALLTREDPPLKLARRRARRQLVEIRATELRFSTREIDEFMNGSFGLVLDPAQVNILEQRTEGWIAALQMAALSLLGHDPARFFQSFAGDNRYIADYLIEEVLQRQTESVRSFLLRTSILERLCPALCAALTGEPHARETLDALERSNLFLIPLDDHREWYRYHHLFAELLRQRLRQALPAGEVADLHRLACAWLESEGEIGAAVRHARQIPDEELARQVLERGVGSFYQLATLPELAELAAGIPPAQREYSPGLCAAVAWAVLAAGQINAVDTWLKAIEQHFSLPASAALDDRELDSARRAALLEVLVIRLHLPAYPQTSTHVLAIRDQLNALLPDQRCLHNVVADLKPVISFNLGMLAEASGETSLAAQAFSDTIVLAREQGNRYLYPVGRAHLAAVQAAAGQLQAARQTCEQGLAEGDLLSVPPQLSHLHARLGALHYEWNDLAAAAREFHSGLALAQLWNLHESRVPITIGLARLRQREGDMEGALRHLAELQPSQDESLVFAVEAYSASLHCLAGDPAAPAAWLAAKMAGLSLEPSPAHELALLDVARVMISLQQFESAAGLLQAIYISAGAGGRKYMLLQARAIHARLLAQQGSMLEAQAELSEILPPAAPEGYISIFLDEGILMRQLLKEAHGKTPLGGLRLYVEQLLAAFAAVEPSPGPRTARPGVPELSDREREILSLAAGGLSNPEIAERLVISITTVKTHMGNIYNKLGVTGRLQAIARAEGLGLLPRH